MNGRRVEWARRAARTLSRLDRRTQGRIVAAVETLAEEGRGDVRRLEGGATDAFRLRVGGWRAIVSLTDDETLVVLRIRPRGDVYKR